MSATPPTPATPSHPVSRRLLSLLTLVFALVLAVVLVLFRTADSTAPTPPTGDSPSPRTLDTLPRADQGITDERRLNLDDAPTVEEILGVVEDPRPTTPQPRFKEIPFEVSLAGLPDCGTWRENPLLADLDGDGRDDLVASNREEDGLNIWRSSPEGAWELAIDGLPRNLMYGGSDAADLDHDGDVDLVFASHKRTTRVFLNEGPAEAKDGEGYLPTWRELCSLESPFLALDLTLGNLNGDEHADAISIAQFAVGRGEGALNVYLGRGDGTFERIHELSTVTGASRDGQQVELADFDHDGLDDLVLTAEKGAQVHLVRIADDGTFFFEDRSEGLPKPPNIGNSLRAVIPADITGDGELEIAFASLADPKIPEGERNNAGVLRWSGERWEQFDTGLPRDRALSDVEAADFDGDGHCDLLYVGPWWGAVIFLGDGAGGFRVAGMLPGSLPGGRAAIGDVNGDGLVDVALSNTATKRNRDGGGVRVYLNRASIWK